MIEISKELREVLNLIQKAGKKVMEIYNTDYNIYEKKDKSPVTEADIIADKIILDGLAQFGLPILSEESKDDLSRLNAKKVWIVDSLDGTMDFLQKTGEFSIMIGLVENGRPIFGAVYLPAFDKLYYAQKGEGAYVKIAGQKEKRISVSKVADLAKAKMIVSRNHLSEYVVDFSKKTGVKFKKCGSNGIKIGLIAEGKADMFINNTDKMGQWDACASDIILSEAGGKLTGMNNEAIIYNKEEIKIKHGLVASNGILHSNIISKL